MNSKKRIVTAFFYVAVVIVAAVALCGLEYRTYIKQYNEKLSNLCTALAEKTDMEPGEIMDLLESEQGDFGDFFYRYGIAYDEDSAIRESRESFLHFIIVTAAVALILALLPVIYLYLATAEENKRIQKITSELANINQGNYSFDMDSGMEGDISILENELYKTAITLKESAENSQKDKESLKDSLSDISHQLKTPLTSLAISLDNLEEYPDLPKEKRQIIIQRAKRDVNKVNKMVQQLLKLSRFDANAIEFVRKETAMADIVDNAMEDVRALCDLKGITLSVEENSDRNAQLLCDAYWETEAVTNILKNGVEHAATCVTVGFYNYELYKEIVVFNDGEPISEEAAKNAFNRFYRGENANPDSVGIGLALAYSIVKEDGGYILAEAAEGGTRFVMRYLI